MSKKDNKKKANDCTPDTAKDTAKKAYEDTLYQLQIELVKLQRPALSH